MKNLATLLVTLFAFVVTSAAGAASIRLREGVDYVRISPVQTQQVPGIEVIEFFSYGCPHCNQFEGTVGKWRATLRKDVTFRRVPISFGNTQWAALAKLYLALEVSGDLSRVDSDVFAAIHVKKLPLTNEKRIGDWIAMRVTDPKKFNEIYQSFGIEAMADRKSVV